MPHLKYHLVDVFTDRPFAGNQLAVFPEPGEIEEDLMQQLANELSLSETTFVFPPQKKANDYWVRIFTPESEIPFAGHPTLGTAFVLAQEGKVKLAGGKATVRFGEGVGPIDVELEERSGRPTLVRMSQPLPKFGAEFSNRQALADMMSLDSAALDRKHPAQVVSCGVPFLIVPLRGLDVIRHIRLRLDVWSRFLKDSEAPCVMPFTMQTIKPESTVHCRMFAPGLGVLEDAATGSANGPLGCYLVKHGLVEAAPTARIISEQGYEMRRPSEIEVEIGTKGEEITSVSVGGGCVYIGSGEIAVGA
ncbi:MAG: PhzF family phenazine biosynthesis protein [bacterium]